MDIYWNVVCARCGDTLIEIELDPAARPAENEVAKSQPPHGRMAHLCLDCLLAMRRGEAW